MIVAILGLGEAGGAIAQDLIQAGVTVRGWDPAPKDIPAEVQFAASNPAAAQPADVILSVNLSTVAIQVAAEVAPVLQPGQVYVDLNTTSPQTKQAMAEIVANSAGLFVEGALMAPVPPQGLHTPVYATGPGARKYQEMFAPFGVPITIVAESIGSAAIHKLLRSIIYKGFAAVVVECMQAAEQLEMTEYAREQIMTLLQDEMMIDRFVQGSHTHARRRGHEMEAAAEMLEGMGVAPHTAQAAIQQLKELQANE